MYFLVEMSSMRLIHIYFCIQEYTASKEEIQSIKDELAHLAEAKHNKGKQIHTELVFPMNAFYANFMFKVSSKFARPFCILLQIHDM